MIARIAAASALAILVAGSAFAASHTSRHASRPHRERQPHTRPTPAPETPPPPEAARLQAFRGVWNFEGTVTMAGAKPRKARWRMGCNTVANGWAIACDHTIRIPHLPVMQMHELTAWSDGALHMFMADNTGSAHAATGNWVDEHTIRARHEGTQNGQPMVEEIELALRDETTIDFHNSVTIGGKPAIAFKGTFHQVPKRARGAHGTPEQQPMPEAATQASPAPAQ